MFEKEENDRNHSLNLDKLFLVTEMKEIKHYFQKGAQARVGIEK